MSSGAEIKADLAVLADDTSGSDSARPGAWQILIVDDDPDVHVTTEFALNGETVLGKPMQFLHANSAAAARQILTDADDIAVILLDVVMETDDAGLQLVRVIREALNLSAPRIILRTGHPGYAPEHDVIRNYDIDDYRTKSELSRIRLFTSVATALRAYDRLRQLMDTNQRLEQLTRELEVLNIDYLEQREAALSAAQAKSRFLSNVSHELRTPLNAIVGFSELSLRALNDGRSVPASYIEDILEAGRRLAAMVDDILDFSQVDSRRRQLVVEPIDVQELVAYQSELYQADAGRLGISLRCQLNQDKRILEVDRASLSKVLGHIVSNALRYSPRHETVEIGWTSRGGELAISVSDRGPGIPKSIKSHLAEPFSIGQDVLTKDASGLGLGLTICRHLTAIMGGIVEIADREGGGTIVSLVFPDRIG